VDVNDRAPAPSIDQARARFEDSYLAYQYHFVDFLTEHLAELSRTFDRDFQEMLVLAIIGQVHLRARMVAPRHRGPRTLWTQRSRPRASRM
jgi:hypothetical protein